MKMILLLILLSLSGCLAQLWKYPEECWQDYNNAAITQNTFSTMVQLYNGGWRCPPGRDVFKNNGQAILDGVFTNGGWVTRATCNDYCWGSQSPAGELIINTKCDITNWDPTGSPVAGYGKCTHYHHCQFYSASRQDKCLKYFPVCIPEQAPEVNNVQWNMKRDCEWGMRNHQHCEIFCVMRRYELEEGITRSPTPTGTVNPTPSPTTGSPTTPIEDIENVGDQTASLVERLTSSDNLIIVGSIVGGSILFSVLSNWLASFINRKKTPVSRRRRRKIAPKGVQLVMGVLGKKRMREEDFDTNYIPTPESP